jgi:hypothetical protein
MHPNTNIPEMSDKYNSGYQTSLLRLNALSRFVPVEGELQLSPIFAFRD